MTLHRVWARIAGGVCVVCVALTMPMRVAAAEHADGIEQAVMLGSDYLHYHRDLRFRLQGLAHLDEGDSAAAHADFLRASKYADKASQAMVAEQLWSGEGVARDRALAYVWMDLAAERGYPSFVAFRERYWDALRADERASALERGDDVLAQYGDAVAMPRLEHLLRKKRTTFTDSRVGNVARGLQVFMVSPQSGLTGRVPRDQVLARKFWHARDYFEWQDAIWERPPQGVVEVGPLRPPPDAAATGDATEAAD